MKHKIFSYNRYWFSAILILLSFLNIGLATYLTDAAVNHYDDIYNEEFFLVSLLFLFMVISFVIGHRMSLYEIEFIIEKDKFHIKYLSRPYLTSEHDKTIPYSDIDEIYYNETNQSALNFLKIKLNNGKVLSFHYNGIFHTKRLETLVNALKEPEEYIEPQKSSLNLNSKKWYRTLITGATIISTPLAIYALIHPPEKITGSYLNIFVYLTMLYGAQYFVWKNWRKEKNTNANST